MKNLLLILFLSLQTFALGNAVASAEGNAIQETEASQSVSTPVQAYDSSGEKVWECALDIYGKAMTVEGEQGFVPFRFQGQYEDVETGLCYNRFRYYSADSGTYLSKDPIGLMGGNNLYSYVSDSNTWIDVMGLSGEIVYQLLDANGNVNYYGITSRDALVRMKEHAGNGKVFSNMEILADGLSHDQARSIEGNLIRDRLKERSGNWSVVDSIEERLKKSGLQNKNRGRIKSNWTSDNPLDDLSDKVYKKPRKISCG